MQEKSGPASIPQVSGFLYRLQILKSRTVLSIKQVFSKYVFITQSHPGCETIPGSVYDTGGLCVGDMVLSVNGVSMLPGSISEFKVNPARLFQTFFYDPSNGIVSSDGVVSSDGAEPCPVFTPACNVSPMLNVLPAWSVRYSTQSTGYEGSPGYAGYEGSPGYAGYEGSPGYAGYDDSSRRGIAKLDFVVLRTGAAWSTLESDLEAIPGATKIFFNQPLEPSFNPSSDTRTVGRVLRGIAPSTKRPVVAMPSVESGISGVEKHWSAPGGPSRHVVLGASNGAYGFRYH